MIASWGPLLRLLREGQALLRSQQRVADAAGLSQDRLSRIERGAEPLLHEAIALRDLLARGVPVEDLMQLAADVAASPRPTDWFRERDWVSNWRGRVRELSMGASSPKPASASPEAQVFEVHVDELAGDADSREAPTAQASEVYVDELEGDADSREAPAGQASDDWLPPPSKLERALALRKRGVEVRSAAEDEELDVLIGEMTDVEYHLFRRKCEAG